MDDPRPDQVSPVKAATSTTALNTPPPPLPPPCTMPHVSLVPPSQKKKRRSGRTFRIFRSIFRSFPIINPVACTLPALPGGVLSDPHRGFRATSKFTGTLFAYRQARVSLSLQENSRCLPTLVIQLAMQMSVLQKDLNSGMVRIALECEKQVEDSTANKEKTTKLMDEPLWVMYYNGKKIGYGIKREATEEDLYVMELLKAVSMGAGVLPPRQVGEDGADGEVSYMRTQFEHVSGSKDSETFYMLSPEGNNGPELTVFMVRL